MKKYITYLTILFFILNFINVRSQNITPTYSILKLPISAKITGLGGDNISIIDTRPDVGWNNPALLSSVDNNTLGVGFMTLGGGSSYLGAQYAKAFGQRHTVAIMGQYMNYGSIQEMDTEGNFITNFSPKDLIFDLSYSYLLSEKFAGGASCKFISQHYNQYKSIGISLDLGLNYYDQDQDLSTSLVLRNLGTQIKDLYSGEKISLPIDLTIGFTKGFEHLPIRLNVTMKELNRWGKSFYYYDYKNKKDISVTKQIIDHFILGLDYYFNDKFYIDLGYNFKKSHELKLSNQSKFAGFTAGAGLQIKKIKISAAYAKYFVGSMGLQFNVAYSLN